MPGGMAVYEIKKGDSVERARFWMRPKDEKRQTPFELEARKIVLDGFLQDGASGRIGYTIDPFKAAESILADHYGYAKMVEADYEWRPRIRY